MHCIEDIFMHCVDNEIFFLTELVHFVNKISKTDLEVIYLNKHSHNEHSTEDFLSNVKNICVGSETFSADFRYNTSLGWPKAMVRVISAQ